MAPLVASRQSLATVLIGLAVLVSPLSGVAAAPRWLDFHLKGKSHTAFPTARYAVDGGGGFVLDRSGSRPLLRFDDSPEIWWLRSARGPRGDEILADDMGEPRLRFNRFGGVTVFTLQRPEGSAAALQGAAAPLRQARVEAAGLYRRLVLASARSSRAAMRLIAFRALDVDANSAASVADAALVATEAVIQLSGAPGGRQKLARVSRVDFVRGRSAEVRYEGGAIHIAVTADFGATARPSSARILEAISRGDRHSSAP